MDEKKPFREVKVNGKTIRLPADLELWSVEKLVPYARNPRTHTDEQVNEIADSILEFGWTNPILIDRDSGIIAGHGRLFAAQKLGLNVVPVIELTHLDEVQRRAYLIADNKLALNADWDEKLLTEELKALEKSDFNLELTGFTEEELSVYLTGDKPDGPDEPQAPEPMDEPVSWASDLWILGDHRLMCGDSSKPEDIDTLLDGAEIHLVYTDPPYNVRVESRTNNAIAAGLSSGNLGNNQSFDLSGSPRRGVATGKMRPKDIQIVNDSVPDEEYFEMLLVWFGNIAKVLKPGRAFYIFGGYINAGNYKFALRRSGLYFSQSLIWIKGAPVLSRKDFMGNHECFFYGWREGAEHKFYGPPNATDVWEIKKVSATKKVHLTEKPVELAVRAIEYSTVRDENVLDLFGGSGSTIIAAEQLERNAFVMELDPFYVDVIIRRWQEYTGKDAILDGTNKTFHEVAEDRGVVA